MASSSFITWDAFSGLSQHLLQVCLNAGPGAVRVDGVRVTSDSPQPGTEATAQKDYSDCQRALFLWHQHEQRLSSYLAQYRAYLDKLESQPYKV